MNNNVGAVSIVSVSKVEAAHPAFLAKVDKKKRLTPYNKTFPSSIRRQDIEDLFFVEGTVYISEVKELLKRRGFYHNKTLGYVVPKWKALEVDDITDFVCIEAIMKNRKLIKGRTKNG